MAQKQTKSTLKHPKMPDSGNNSAQNVHKSAILHQDSSNFSTIKVSDLSPNPKNPRKITDKKLAMLKKSYEAFGSLSGIIFNEVTKQLVGGHQTSKILPPDAEIILTKQYEKPTEKGTIADGYALIAGEKIPFRKVIWDEPTEKAANIAANKGAGEWDFPLLSEMLISLDEMNFDLDLTMFDEDELEKVIVPIEHVPPSGDADHIPAPPKDIITKRGDIWLLGEHRLMCGDATMIDDIDKLMGDEKPDMVFTDPPYGVKERTNRKDNKRFGAAESQNFEPVMGDESEKVAEDAFPLAVSLANTVIYWGANNYSFLPKSRGWIVWDKRENKGTDDNGDAELAWTNQDKPIRTFYHLWKGMIKGSEHGESRLHPTQKPVALAEWCFENYGDPDTVLDLFGGSGATLIACEKTQRKCFMMELSEAYCDAVCRRFEVYTGKKADLITPGATPNG